MTIDNDINESGQFVVVPWKELSETALGGLIEEYVSRDGTDYGAVEVSLDQKKAMARQAIVEGSVLIVFDLLQESSGLIDKEALQSADYLDNKAE